MAEKKLEVLQRRVSLFEAVAMITGLVVGASIFILVPTLIGMTGPSVYLCYAAAAIPAIFVVLYQIQLTGTLPVTGANYVAVTRVLNPAWGAILSFSAVLALIASNVLVAVGFGKYVITFIQSFNPGFNLHPLILPLAVLLLFSLLNFLGVEIASVIQTILFLAFVIGMIIFSIAGSADYHPANMTPLFPGGALMFIVATVLACFSWAGRLPWPTSGGTLQTPAVICPWPLSWRSSLFCSSISGNLWPW